MLDPSDIDRRLQHAALPWRASEGKAYILNAAGMEVARFSDRGARDLVVEAVNGLVELMGRVGAMEADAETTHEQCNRLIECAHDATARLDIARQKMTVDGEFIEALKAERDSLAERLAIAETREVMALRQVDHAKRQGFREWRQCPFTDSPERACMGMLCPVCGSV